MNANPVLLQKKYARIIELYSKKYGVDMYTALDLFYRSILYQEMREGISGIHCMGDDYLTEELYSEYNEK